MEGVEGELDAWKREEGSSVNTFGIGVLLFFSKLQSSRQKNEANAEVSKTAVLRVAT